jgi:hypothetical protein
MLHRCAQPGQRLWRGAAAGLSPSLPSAAPIALSHSSLTYWCPSLGRAGRGASLGGQEEIWRSAGCSASVPPKTIDTHRSPSSILKVRWGTCRPRHIIKELSHRLGKVMAPAGERAASPEGARRESVLVLPLHDPLFIRWKSRTHMQAEGASRGRWLAGRGDGEHEFGAALP